jgi:broad specificity phosphatase PhoE
MTTVVFIRHGPTPWNAEGRIQGQTDVPLGKAGSAEVSRWTVPAKFRGYDWTASPLSRARETARLLGLVACVDARLSEMSWGEWEGHTWDEVRSLHGPGLAAPETSGLDFRPPAGESRRSLLARLQAWLADTAVQARPAGAVTHRGVIHAALALATGWDMQSRAPYRLNWASAHLFRLDDDARLCVAQLNIALVTP